MTSTPTPNRDVHPRQNLNRILTMKSSNPAAQPSSASFPEEGLTTQPSQGEGSTERPSSVKQVASDAKRSAGNMLNQAKERASSMAQEQKQSAAQHIGRYGSALRDSARSVEQEDPNVAYYANRAAEGIEKVADYVRSTDLAGLQRDAEDIARRHPALFMGGMLLAGIVVGGLVKASAATAREASMSDSGSSFDDMDSLESPDVNASQAGSSL
jgi:hypothetical protein